MAGMKKSGYRTIDEYLDSFPPKVKKLLQAVRRTIHKAAPEATEKISYQIPTFYLNRNLVHFAAFSDHISFFPTSSGIAAFKKELKNYKTAKGTVQFPLDKPLPLALIARIVKFRVKENMVYSPHGRK